jgi:hypothetical protein
LTCVQNVEFQKLELKWSARWSIKIVSLFLSPIIPRFSFGFDDAFRVYNLLVWKFGSSIESYLGFIWVNSNLSWNSNLNPFLRPKRNWKASLLHRGPPTSLLAQLCFRPVGGPASHARAPTNRRAAPRR